MNGKATQEDFANQVAHTPIQLIDKLSKAPSQHFGYIALGILSVSPWAELKPSAAAELLSALFFVRRRG